MISSVETTVHMRSPIRLLTAVACILTVGWIDPVYERNSDGIRLYNNGKYGESAERFLAIREITDMPEIVHFNLGNAYYKQRDYRAAMEEYFRAVGTADRGLKARIYYNLGNCQYYTGDLEKSLHYFRKAISLNREDRDARVNFEFVLNRLTHGGTGSGDNRQRGPEQGDVESVPSSGPGRSAFDERDREMIYRMLDAEEMSRRQRLRLDGVSPPEGRDGKW
jgi:tetratricopeptide (TPR) repeat protein